MKTKKILLMFLVTSLYSLLNTACVAIPEPRGRNSVLLLGRLVHEGIGSMTSGAAAPSERKVNEIRMKIMPLEGGKAISIDASGRGFFLVDGIPAGRYAIREIEARLVEESTNLMLRGTIPNPLSFNVIEGRVNNLGTILWTTDFTSMTIDAARASSGSSTEAPPGSYTELVAKRESEKAMSAARETSQLEARATFQADGNSLTFPGAHQEVMNHYKERHPDSLWWSMPWEEVFIK